MQIRSISNVLLLFISCRHLDQLAYKTFEELVPDMVPLRKNVQTQCSLGVPIDVRLRFEWGQVQPGGMSMGLVVATLRKSGMTTNSRKNSQSPDDVVWAIQSAHLYAQWHLSSFGSATKYDPSFLADLENDFLQELYIVEEKFSQEKEVSDSLCRLGPDIHQTKTLTFRVYFPPENRLHSILQVMTPNQSPLKFRLVIAFSEDSVIPSSSVFSSSFHYVYEIPVNVKPLVS
jgi:hypothetical protein